MCAASQEPDWLAGAPTCCTAHFCAPLQVWHGVLCSLRLFLIGPTRVAGTAGAAELSRLPGSPAAKAEQEEEAGGEAACLRMDAMEIEVAAEEGGAAPGPAVAAAAARRGRGRGLLARRGGSGPGMLELCCTTLKVGGVVHATYFPPAMGVAQPHLPALSIVCVSESCYPTGAAGATSALYCVRSEPSWGRMWH